MSEDEDKLRSIVGREIAAIVKIPGSSNVLMIMDSGTGMEISLSYGSKVYTPEGTIAKTQEIAEVWQGEVDAALAGKEVAEGANIDIGIASTSD